jgi:tetratricopeptide (TPR) repeat protein
MSLLERLRGWMNAAGPARERSVPLPDASPLHTTAKPVPRSFAGDPGDDVDARIASLEAAVAADPENAQAHLALAEAQQAAGMHDDAADSYLLAIHYRCDDPQAWLGLAGLQSASGRADDAVRTCREASARFPRSGAIATTLALALLRLERVEEALAASDHALNVAPGLAEAWHNRGLIRLQTGATVAALEDFERALVLMPASVATQSCRAHALRDLGRFDEALARYAEVLAQAPDFADASANLARTELLLGRYASGWARYEQRFGTTEAATARGVALPPWRGEDLAGRSVLVLAEQGLGDEIMFASCLPDVMARAGRCVIDCSERLAPLFTRSFSRASVHGGRKSDGLGWLAQVGPIDFVTPIGSLPRYLRPDAAAFPDRAGYLVPDPAEVARYRARLDALGPGPWVGVSWRGGNVTSRGGARSIDLEQLAGALGALQAGWVSLQHGEVAAELERARTALGFAMQRFEDIPRNIDRLAALMGALDLVVSVDNTNAHLAGALGRPVWVLLPHVPEWRYGTTGESMPWYPTARLLRQEGVTDWSPVLARLAAELALRYPSGRHGRGGIDV